MAVSPADHHRPTRPPAGVCWLGEPPLGGSLAVVDLVLARAAGADVVVRARRERQNWRRRERVVAVDEVVARAATDGVAAEVAPQRVVAFVAGHTVVQGAGEDGVVTRAALDAVIAAEPDELVVAGSPQHGVIATEAGEHIIARPADQDIIVLTVGGNERGSIQAVADQDVVAVA